jgi:tetratricopeptide (TPR) repeat protein
MRSFGPRRRLSLSAAPALAATAFLVLSLAGGGLGCGRKQVRQPSADEVGAFVERKIEEGRSNIARRPPQSALALENAQDILALDPKNFEALLIESDAYYQLRYYKYSLASARRAEKLQPKSEEALYRKARGYYWFHTYWSRGNYRRAREAAQACLTAGNRYLVECHAIIRNSYLGEDSRNGPSRDAYARAAKAGEELLAKLPAGHAARGDLLLTLAGYYALNLEDPNRARAYLDQARQAALTDPGLERRLVAYENDRDLDVVLSSGQTFGPPQTVVASDAGQDARERRNRRRAR